MIPNFKSLSNCLNSLWPKREAKLAAPPPAGLPLQRPNLHHLAQDEPNLPQRVRQCPVALKYLRLLGPLAWDHFPERDPNAPWPGHQPQPRAPFVAAYLVKLHEQKRYMSQLRTYLIEHPALVWLLGFPLVPSADSPWGFDVATSLPSASHLLTVLRTLDNQVLQFLLDSTVHLIRQELPQSVDFGQIISLDTKHIIAWVKENNPKVFIKEGRYDKTNIPPGDRTCRLGVKKRRNQKVKADQSPSQTVPTPTKDPRPARNQVVTDIYWGYGTGLVATKVPGWGEFVLAELTQTFDKNDITYFFILMAAVERRLGFRPPYGAFDAAFDAWYVYQHFAEVDGLAAVPFSGRGGDRRHFNDQGLPLCQAGLPMPIKNTFMRRKVDVPHQQARHACPLLFPTSTGQTCPQNHKNWAKGGCTTTLATAQGARIRHLLDRDSELYQTIYKQRSATERVNSLAVELGIERPKLRNRQAITNQNTLIYVLINLHALQRLRGRKQPLAQQTQTDS